MSAAPNWLDSPELPKLVVELLGITFKEMELETKGRIKPMAKGKLYTYAVLFHPKPTRDAGGNDTTPKSEILIKPTDVLATDDKQVAMIATRQIPKDYEDKLDLVEVIVRPFFQTGQNWNQIITTSGISGVTTPTYTLATNAPQSVSYVASSLVNH